MSHQVPYHEIDGEKEEGSYIIKLKANANKQSIIDWINSEYSGGGTITHDYNESSFYHGFAAECSQDLLNALRSHRDIEYITEDAIVLEDSTTLAKAELGSDETEAISGSAKQQGTAPIDSNATSLGNKIGSATRATGSRRHIVQEDSTWGLDRISHRGPAKQPYKYVYPESAGHGVIIFVLDTGVYIEHDEFEGRARYGVTYYSSDEDKRGHGTHVAGTAIGKTFGAAKKANVVSVKVLGDNGRGRTSVIIAGIDWVVQQTRMIGKVTIMNMSLSGPVNIALDDAVNAAAESGVLPVVAAGNQSEDASNRSPARAEGAFTVGAIQVSDDRASYSNYGSCVEIYAPGSHVLSAGIRNRQDTAIKSGTSMATPHVSGTCALFISEIGKPVRVPDIEGAVIQKSDTTKQNLRVVQVPL